MMMVMMMALHDEPVLVRNISLLKNSREIFFSRNQAFLLFRDFGQVHPCLRPEDDCSIDYSQICKELLHDILAFYSKVKYTYLKIQYLISWI